MADNHNIADIEGVRYVLKRDPPFTSLLFPVYFTDLMA
jgi:hypothetical protein